jgi:lipopolysaccharide/colanic/teichoic acid biosynthesis glycosyltransferase
MMRLSTHAKKRILDVILVLVALPVILPLLLCIGFLVAVSSRGPVLYRATRIGRNMQPFQVYKFRTMVTNNSALRVTRSGDPRITAVGHWLRASKLDELPQVLNVLRGEMSLVGPRPEDPKYVKAYNKEQYEILSVPPGMTSAAFLHFGNEQKFMERANASDLEGFYVHEILPTKLAIELEYVHGQKLSRDMKIIARTFVHLFQ